jgi:hypothetical protein
MVLIRLIFEMEVPISSPTREAILQVTLKREIINQSTKNIKQDVMSSMKF